MTDRFIRYHNQEGEEQSMFDFFAALDKRLGNYDEVFINEEDEQEKDEQEKDQERLPLGIRNMLNTFKTQRHVVDNPVSVKKTLTLSSTENTTTGANTFSWEIQEKDYEEREPKLPSPLSNLVADGSRYVEFIDMLMVRERLDIGEVLNYLIRSIENNTTDNIVK